MPIVFKGLNRLILLWMTLWASLSFASQSLNEDFYTSVSNLYPDTLSSSQSPVRIAVVYPGLQTSDYWQRSLRAMKARLEQIQQPYILDVRFSQPYLQVDLQEAQLLEVLKKDPDYLIYTVNSDRQKHMLESVLQRKRPKVIVQNLTRPIREWFEIQPLIYVGFDHIRGAKLLASYYKKRFSKGTEYGILFWDRGVVSQQRGVTFFREIGEHHKLVASYFTQASRGKARQATLRMLNENPKLSYIYACATDVALGALDALKELGREDVVVNGWGGGMSELEAFRAGQLDVVLMRMNDQNGIAIAEAISRDNAGLPVPQVYSGDFRVLSDKTSLEQLESLIQQAFIYSSKPTQLEVE